ncbi:Flp family type IVb pilin [Parasphingopyxis marina]|jgi:pilus assembly protein Flp/PilA|uniref:Flp family type IVb pilin n=1 Tax=Parasphingopyxis marina TaxID=2761622 RepID=A0A842I044_9SPHN|nr:Flp family type IVb pilin [Parasphingopyxis marina]MBC2778197.1 Flp family type IVb pilin [Parasphingopyxis marina]
MRHWLGRIARDERGATAIEYGLIVSLVVIAMVGALVVLADTTTGMWNNVSNTVESNS